MPFRRKLQCFHLEPELIADHTVVFDRECWDVTAAGNNIFESCHNYLAPDPKKGDTQVLDIQGNEERRLGKSNFSEQFRKLINRYKRIGYSLDIRRQTACLVISPIIVVG